MQGQALPGFRDFYPEELALRNYIFATWREVARRYGFQEYDGPPLEPQELYTEKSGEEIVQQLYAFPDKGGRAVALRPEMTPTLARMVGARAQALKKPLRWFSIPQLFRYERQHIMRAFDLGPKHVRLRLSDRRILTAALQERHGVSNEEMPGVLVALDKWEEGAADAVEDRLQQALGDSETRQAGVSAFLAALGNRDRTLTAALLESPYAEPLNESIRRLEAMGFDQFVEVDFRIVRGLAYYTGIVFELFDAEQSLRAICGGGRYDDLIGQMTGVDLPCVGFGMGDVVLRELLGTHHKDEVAPTQLDAFLVAVSGEDVDPVLELAAQLRRAGLGVEYALRNQPIRKQLELAAARGAPRAVIIGPDERKAKVAIVRDLKTGRQRRVSLARVRKGMFR